MVGVEVMETAAEKDCETQELPEVLAVAPQERKVIYEQCVVVDLKLAVMKFTMKVIKVHHERMDFLKIRGREEKERFRI